MNDKMAPGQEWPPPPSSNLPPLHPRYGQDTAVTPPDAPSGADPTGTAPPSRDAREQAARASGFIHPAPTPAASNAPTQPGPWEQHSQLGTSPPQHKAERRRSPGRAFIVLMSFIAMIAGAAAALGIVYVAGGFESNTSGTTTRTIVKPGSSSSTTVAPSGLDVVAISEAVRPAIVKVTTNLGEGSGVIYDSDGLIMTNNHVVAGSRGVEVELTDGRTLSAEVLGSDAETDIAVLRIDADGLPAATLGTATNLDIGTPVVAIGNPLGLEGGPTVTVGYISTLGRTVQVGPGEPPLLDMIQTDASIAPGSSGGALLTGDGTVIGITTAIAVSEVGAGDIGFATPIDIAKQIAAQITATGDATHPFLGIRGMDIDADTAAAAGTDDGALIITVEPGTPAAEAGLQPDDVVIAIDGNAVTSMSGLKVALRSRSVGDTVVLTILRDGNESTVDVTLGEAP